VAELGRGFRRLAADVFLRLTTVQVALHNIALGALSLIVVLRAEQQGLPGVLIGVLVAAQAAGALLGSLAAPRLLDRLAAGRIVLMTGWSWCGLVPVIAFTGRPALVLPCLVALWFLVPVQRSVIGLYQVRATPDAQVGRVVSAFSVVTTSLSGLGLLLGGYLLESAAPMVTAVVLGAITLAPVLVSSASRGMRRARVPLQPATQ
jgi:predicted MFS family arabinose efflux permease